MKRLALPFLIVGLLLLGACAPASVSEPTIPAHFTTYKLGLFSISYPSDWELASSMFIEGITRDVENYLRDIGSIGSLAGGEVVFFGGIPYETGYNPNVNVIVILSSEGRWELEDLIDAVQREYMNDAEEYYEFSRTKTVVDGSEAIILDCAAKYPSLGEWHSLQMFLRDNNNNLLWIVTCSVIPPKDFSDFEDDFYAIVKSLRTH